MFPVEGVIGMNVTIRISRRDSRSFSDYSLTARRDSAKKISGSVRQGSAVELEFCGTRTACWTKFVALSSVS